MAGDWIKMRVSLAKDPRVIAMADFLAEHRGFMGWLSDPVRATCKETAYERVTRNVTVAVTVSALLQVWGIANEAGKPDCDDLVMCHTRLDHLDEVCGVPGFGEAMEFVEWAAEEKLNGKPCVRLPKFLINNTPAEDRAKKSNAERQRRFREKHSATDNAESNVTDNVTVTHREEKRREEKKEQKLSAGAVGFEDFWSAYPQKIGKKPAKAKWEAKRLDSMAAEIVADVRARSASDRKWREGYVPNPATYLTQERWNDEIQTGGKSQPDDWRGVAI